MKVEVQRLTKDFGKTKAVDNISFCFSAGDIVGFIGPNGAGKTTTMRIISALEEPTQGDILLEGGSIVEYPEHAMKNIGYMPDSLPAQSNITVHEFLDFFARAFGLNGSSRKEAIRSTENFTNLTGLRNKTLKQLSKGMKQRVSLARAIIHDPAVLILDEPAAGLDPRARLELLEMLKDLAARGKAILVSSHILSELSEICDSALIIDNGRLLYGGRIQDILKSKAAVRNITIGHIESAPKIVEILENRDDVKKIEIGDSVVSAAIADDQQRLADLLGSLINGGCRITEFKTSEITLSDVFMDLTNPKVNRND